MKRQSAVSANNYRTFDFVLIKWVLISFAVLNILSTIWVGIYLDKAVERAAKQLPDSMANFSDADHRTTAKVWKGFMIAFLVIIDIVNLIGIFGAYKEHYKLTMIYGVVLMAFAIISAVSDYTRDSYTSWIVPFAVAILAFVFAHKIRTEQIQTTVYSSASSA